MRDGLKRALGVPVARFVGLSSRRSADKLGVAVVYHRVADPPQNREDHVVPALGTALFERHLRHLKAVYRPVGASELPAAVRARRPGDALPVAITFDDDLPSHCRTVMGILRRLDVSATFFLTGASLSVPHSFWWERLQVAFDRGLIENSRLAAILPESHSRPPRIRPVARQIEAMPRRERERISSLLLDEIGGEPPDAGLRSADVRALAAAGFEIGFHTRGHDVLPVLDDESLQRAMTEGRAKLAEAARQDISTIAYPHGKADARVAEAARMAGYRVGFTGRPGPVVEGDDPLLLNRIDPSSDSVGRFALQVARPPVLAGR